MDLLIYMVLLGKLAAPQRSCIRHGSHQVSSFIHYRIKVKRTVETTEREAASHGRCMTLLPNPVLRVLPSCMLQKCHGNIMLMKTPCNILLSWKNI